MSESYDTGREAGKGQSAAAYGRNAADLAKRRARQETLEREISGLAKHLAEPLEGDEPEGARRGFFARMFGLGKSKKGADA